MYRCIQEENLRNRHGLLFSYFSTSFRIFQRNINWVTKTNTVYSSVAEFFRGVILFQMSD